MFAFAFAAQSASLPVAAQDTSSSTNVVDAIKPALEKAAREGATIIVVGNSSDASKAGSEANNPGIAAILNRALFRFKLTLGNSGQAIGNMKATLSKASPDNKINWLFYAVLAGVVSIVVGRLTVRPVTHWIRDVFAPRIPDVPDNRQQKISYVLFRGAIFVVTALLTAAIGTLVVIWPLGRRQNFVNPFERMNLGTLDCLRKLLESIGVLEVIWPWAERKTK